MPEDSWDKQYELTLTLYVESTEVAYLMGKFEEMKELTKVVFSRSKNLLDKIKVYEINLLAYSAQGKLIEAIDIGLKALKLLGIEFPKKPTQEDIMEALQETRLAWISKEPSDLIHLPEMSVHSKIAALSILNSLSSCAYNASPELFPLIALKQAYLSVKYGNASLSCYAYAIYGTILCGVAGEIELGFQFGQLALMLSQRENARKISGRTTTIINLFLIFWKKQLRETLKPLLGGYHRAMEAGDLEYAAWSLHIHSCHSYFAGKELKILAEETVKHAQILTRIHHSSAFNLHLIYKQAVFSLIGTARDPGILIEDANREERNIILIYQAYLNQAILSFIFENLEETIDNLKRAEKYLGFFPCLLAMTIFYFYDSLAKIAVFNNAEKSEQKSILLKVTANQEKMKQWAEHAPMNFLHKYYLVEAEKHRVLGETAFAREEYDLAIELAKENEYLNEEALANELAGKFYLAKGKTKIARVYLQEARYCYQKWGAKAKVAHLDKTYPQLLEETPIITPNFTTTISSGQDLLKSLDLETVFKAYQAISGEIVLDKLLETLMKIIIENAGAREGYLILTSEENHWQIAASVTSSSTEVKLAETPTAETLPHAIVNYVIRSRETLVLNDAAREGNFTGDPYILQQKPQSVLCAPLINRGKLIGVIYLENKLTAGAFTPPRLEVLNLLSSQAAISLENATLYSQLEEYSHSLEEKVEERTAQLAEATKKAQAASEAKSAFLANMSHELRSPLNAILGFSQLTSCASNLPSEHRDNLGIINRSGEHLLTLINQVLDLSKIEAGRITLNEKSFDLQRLLGDIEDMFSFKAEDKGLHLLLEVEDNLPRYICSDEVKLRQILINLLNNALKFTANGGVSVRVKTVDGSLSDPEELTTIGFEVEDTGAGIASEELEGIFEAFVQSATGKQAQEGTGLGLAISRKFVQLMGGEMTVSSEVGVGTVFKFEIKAKIVTAGDIETFKPSRRIIALEANQPRWRILVVDDRLDNRQLLIKLLNPLGFELKEAANGREAIAIWEEWEPHLIWMDLRMPVMNGYEAAKYIKSTTKGEATAIVALTASVLEEERSLVLSAGCDDFLRKPFRKDVLFEKMAEHLGVCYVYEDSVDSQLPPEDISQNSLESALEQMPREWIVSLHDATVEGDIAALAEAIALIPPSLSPLAGTLSTWVNEYEFDKIIELTESVIVN